MMEQRGKGLAFLLSGVESASRQVLSFVLSLAILAFVTPHDLGIYALAFSMVLVLAMVVGEPIGEALIQHHDANEGDWNTGFTLNLVVAAVVTGLSFAARDLVARLFHEPDLAIALPIMSSSILVGAFGGVQKAYLARHLHFARLAQVSLISNVVGGVVALGLAIAGYGYFALMSNLVVSNLVATILYWRFSPWKPRPRLVRSSMVGLGSFAGQSFASQCVLQIRESMLPVAIGWFGGTVMVGNFTLALRLARTLGLFFEDVTRRPLFALMSRLQAGGQPTGPLLLQVIGLLGAVALPAFAGLALVGPVLTPLIFGARWVAGGDLLPLLCGIVLGWLTLHVPATALRATGRPGRAFAVLAVPTLIDLGLIIAIMPFGIEQALLAIAIRAAVWLVVLVVLFHRQFGLSATKILGHWSLPLTGIVAMAVAIELLPPLGGPHWLQPVLLTAAGSAVYAATLAVGLALGQRHLLEAARAMRKAG